MNTVSMFRQLVAPALPVRRYRGADRSPQPHDGTLESVIDVHFTTNSEPNHPNRESLAAALALLDEQPARILETGSSAWGTNSTRLFDRYVRRFGGEVVTIDIRPAAARALRAAVSPQTTMLVGDSLRVLRDLAKSDTQAFDFVYLDSFDLDVEEPIAAMAHGIAEFLWLGRLLKPGAVILIDDTPGTSDDYRDVAKEPLKPMGHSTVGHVMPGKGALVEKLYDRAQFELIFQGYQLALRKR